MIYAKVETPEVNLTTVELKEMTNLTILHDGKDEVIYNKRYQDGAIHVIFKSGLDLICLIHRDSNFKCFTYPSGLKIVCDTENHFPLEMRYSDRIEYYDNEFVLNKIFRNDTNTLEEYDTKTGIKIKDSLKDGTTVFYYNGIKKKRVFKDNERWYYREDETLELYSKYNPEDNSLIVEYYDIDGKDILYTRYE